MTPLDSQWRVSREAVTLAFFYVLMVGGVKGGCSWWWMRVGWESEAPPPPLPYTKLPHPYSSHANGKTTRRLFPSTNGANWKRKLWEQTPRCSRGGQGWGGCQIISPPKSPWCPPPPHPLPQTLRIPGKDLGNTWTYQGTEGTAATGV